MPRTSGDTFTPPYIPFQTLLTFLDELAANDIPPRIDRTMLGHMSGTTQSFLLATLRSLGLIGDNLDVQPELEALALDSSGRPERVGGLLRRYYPEQIRLGQATATAGQLQESFREYGLSGDTVRKAIRFFLHAADYAGIKLSPYFGTATTTAATAGRQGGRRRAAKAKASPPRNVEPSVTSPGVSHRHTVAFRSGGNVTLEVSVNLFDLGTDDREFVLALIDSVRGYDSHSNTGDETPELDTS
jgi:hypothetical protein